MEVEFLHCPILKIPESVKKYAQLSRPQFEKDLFVLDPVLKQLVARYKKYKNFLILSNGGSRTGLYFLYNAFRLELKQEVEFVTSSDATYLSSLAKKYKSKDTCVVVISKSGTNVTPLECMLYFMKKRYTILTITGETGALRDVALEKKYDVVIHPAVGGRFSFFSSCALFLAAVWGFSIDRMRLGAKASFKKYGYGNLTRKNSALVLSTILFQLEKKGYTEVCNGIYDRELASSLPLIVQLMHESVCKDGKTGQTFFGDEGPEVQHHTMQRLYGGRRNIVLLLTRLQKKMTDALSVPKKLQEIHLRQGTLNVFDGVDLGSALDYELMGNMQHCKKAKIPCVLLQVPDKDIKNFAEYVVFWFYVAVYSALLRGVDPFDQPHVEFAKQNTFDLLLKR